MSTPAGDGRPVDALATPGTTAAGAPIDAAQHWSKQTHAYSCFHVRLQLMLDACAARQPARVFEIGCGVGVFRRELLRRLPQVDYWGCDVSESAVREIAHPQVVRADLNVDPLPFPDLEVDCVVASGVLEYVRDLQGLLRELRRRLVPGGQLLVTYFNFRHFYRLLRTVLRRGAFFHPTWCHSHSPAAFRRILQQAGFDVVDVCPNNLGLGGSPSIGQEKWRAGPLRALRKVPGIGLFAHQLIYDCRARA